MLSPADMPSNLHNRRRHPLFEVSKRLKTLRGLTVFEFISQKWTSEPKRFRCHPDHLIPGPNI